MSNKKLPYQQDAVATKIGWVHPDTGEQLVSKRGLETDTNTDDYRPNSRKWAKDRKGAPESPSQ